MEKPRGEIGPDFFDRLWEESWTYIKTVVDVVREPVLILDKDLRIIAANEPFYETFKVMQKDTNKKIVYEIGNGQWNIPALKKLLEDILSKDTFFKGFEVVHTFPAIGKKVMILNARQIHFKEDATSELFPPIIMLAMEDVTTMMSTAEKLAAHVKDFEATLTERTLNLESVIGTLQKEILSLKETQKNHSKKLL
jgi:nitrogen-specific signal transduction histidine kinase